ncbi:GNAT family N-acetyltransferase [Piscinibacter sp.]|uniref:GNAT family N-acetyltransferase n=1 Tax=Piscinibacter sp. TaxID=1903157 RepID=UPI002BDD9DA3|nr:GNAT family N-acetyltransferase [Albitalea sp.]HUG24060.1 GNAT family N-acetyltransferase [Albitalea sp.]
MLGAQVFLDTYATDGIRPSLADEVLAQFSTDAVSALLSEPDVGFIVAECAAHLVGFAQLRFACGHERVLDSCAAKLDRLYVQRPFFGRGIGKALLRRAEERAASRAASALWLTAWADNDRALAFYARQGYEDVGSTVYTFQREQYENRVFTKSLPTPAAD